MVPSFPVETQVLKAAVTLDANFLLLRYQIYTWRGVHDASVQPRQQLPYHLQGLLYILRVGSFGCEPQVVSQVPCRSDVLIQV